MEQIVSMLSKEINLRNILIKHTLKGSIVIELATYSNKKMELYCIYQDSNKVYFLLTYSLLSNKLKSLIKMNISNSLIIQIILQPYIQDQLCLLNENGLNIIKSISDYTKNNVPQGARGIIYHTSFESNTILQFNFSYYENYFGVLLSNGAFYFDSIFQKGYNYYCMYSFYEKHIINFNFIPLHPSGWENFLLIMMSRNGSFYLCGPLFPEQFSLDKEYIISMKEINARKKQTKNLITKDNSNREILMNDFLLQNIQECIAHNFKKTVLIKSNDYLKDFNKNLILKEMIVDNREVLNTEYKQFTILNGSITTLLRFSTHNTIDIFIITGEFNLIRKDTKELPNKIYHIEHIDLCEELYTTDNFKCIQFNPGSLVLVLMNNIYSIDLPYINQLKDFTNDIVNNSHRPFNFQSNTRQLIKHTSLDTNIFLNYYFIDVIDNNIAFIAYQCEKPKLIPCSINLINPDMKNSNENKYESMKDINNQLKQKPKGNLIQYEHQKSSIISENQLHQQQKNIYEEDDLIKNDFNDYSQGYKELLSQHSDIFLQEKITFNSILIKNKKLINMLQFKDNNLLNTFEYVDILSKEVCRKRKRILKKIAKISLINDQLFNQKGKASKFIIKNRLEIIKSQSNELISSLKSINESIVNLTKVIPFQSTCPLNLNDISQDNIDKIPYYSNSLQQLKNSIIKMRNELKCFN